MMIRMINEMTIFNVDAENQSDFALLNNETCLLRLCSSYDLGNAVKITPTSASPIRVLPHKCGEPIGRSC